MPDLPIITYRKAYANACLQLKNAGFSQEATSREAMELLAFCCGTNNLRLMLDFDSPMDDVAAEHFVDAVNRLAGNEPMAYITGSRLFGDLEFKLVPGVLIPRQDTMVLVDEALARLTPDKDANILDLGCGCGVVIAAVALARPNLRGLAVDIDPLAVEVTEENIRRHGLSDRLRVALGSWFAPVDKSEKFHMILSNPPYISAAEMAELPESVKKEPELALYGGKDGLDCYRDILPPAFQALEDEGWCLVEIGWKQGPAVKAMFESAGFSDVTIYRDEGDRDRVVAGRKLRKSAGKVKAAEEAKASREAAVVEKVATAEKNTLCWRIDDPADARIKEAGRLIREGGLVAFPTETVYGLGANGLDEKAVAAIFQVKNRPADNPLILHVASVADAKTLAARWSDKAQRLAEQLWPGPLTIIVPAAGHIPRNVTAGLATVAIRFPSHPIALALIEAAGVPIAAPSANASGRPSTTRAEHVMEDIAGKIDVLIDSGPCLVGLESTILDLSVEPPEILRPGDITRSALERIVGEVLGGEVPDAEDHDADNNHHGAPKAPGMKYRHYAPKAPATILNGAPGSIAVFVKELLAQPEAAEKNSSTRRKTALLLCEETWKLLASGDIRPDKAGARFYCRDMGGRDRPKEMGALLYDALRACDGEGATQIYIEACTAEGQGAAVLNRLYKAAGGNTLHI